MNDSDPIIENRRQTDRSRRRTRMMIGVATLLIASGVVGGVSLYHRYYGIPKRFAVVDDRILYRSAQPKPAQITHVIDDLGIKTIVIAREGTSRNVPDEVKIGEQHGARVVNIPVESRRPIPDSQIEAFFSDRG
ncbi:MAG: hypothetical protein IPK83_12840 [Planctomycetes bacterium]|nr:hypothetical protein [Planctomycetota bacterium]